MRSGTQARHHLIEVQRRSYERFLQMDLLPSEREDAGLQAVFNSVFPITDFRGISQLDFVDYSIGNWECKCGHLRGLHHLRSTCKNCGSTVKTDPFKMGDVLFKKRDFDAAVVKLRRAVELDPTGDSLAALAWALTNDPKSPPAAQEEARVDGWPARGGVGAQLVGATGRQREGVPVLVVRQGQRIGARGSDRERVGRVGRVAGRARDRGRGRASGVSLCRGDRASLRSSIP